MTVLQWVVAAAAIYVLLVFLSNMLAMPRFGDCPARRHYPRVSVLVPARNEEENLPRLIPSLLAQDYPDFEVVVLDDNSTDRTADILAEFARRDSRVRVLSGLPHRPGWIGKNWACHQLSEATTSEWMLFTDADTVHKPGALRAAMDAALHHPVDFLTAIIGQEVRSWGERLVVPFFSTYHIFCAVPLELGYRLRSARVFAANGQFLLFRRQAYDEIGGYAAARDTVLDDQALVSRITRHGLRWRMCDGSRFVRCRMYTNWAGVFRGFTKNVFVAFGGAIVPYCLVWTGIALLFFEPLVVLALAALRFPLAPAGVPVALATILATLLLWLGTARRFRFPFYLAFMYPATIGLALVIAVRSVVMLSTGHATWKGRTIAQPLAGPAKVSRARPALRPLAFLLWFASIAFAFLFSGVYRLRH